MASAKARKEKLKKKLTLKYRLVIVNEDTFEERFSIKLSRLNVFVLSGLFSVFLITVTVLFIAFTPIREYIPGYTSTKLKKQATLLTFKSDSLQIRLQMLENYTQSVRPILTGELTGDHALDSIKDNATIYKIDPTKLNASKEDSLFRENVENRDRFSIVEKANKKAAIVFFAPLSGTISQTYNANNKHFAVDVAAKTGTPIKAVADGTVVFSEWTTETGYVIIAKHGSNFISIYKHCGVVLKQQGDLIRSGEVIANVGSTGELTTGPHLHFELWSDGYAVNPLNYIDFK